MALSCVIHQIVAGLGRHLHFSLAAFTAYSCNDSGANNLEYSEKFPEWFKRWSDIDDGCSAWMGENHETALSRKKTQTSDIPTLIISGENDPRTPYIWSENIINLFSHVQQFILDKNSHEITDNVCAPHLMKAFINDPGNLIFPKNQCRKLKRRTSSEFSLY